MVKLVTYLGRILFRIGHYCSLERSITRDACKVLFMLSFNETKAETIFYDICGKGYTKIKFMNFLKYKNNTYHNL